MNRSRYVTRPLDATDRAIIAALNDNGRMTVRELAEQIGMSSPSVTERIHKLEDTGAIQGYTIIVDPTVFGLGIFAHVRVRAMPGEAKRVAQMLIDTPEIVEADHVTGEDCFLAKVVVGDLQELETVIDRFLPFSSTDTAIIQSSTVLKRLPKL
tara:strand:+ start:377 stop:838 length:462 start_codon:yes stop_codon:yes gene_type:complete